MSFDKLTRNRLQNLVGNCRRAVQADIEDQLQSRYGMYRADERIQPIGELSALSFEDQDIASQLRDLFSHYRAQEHDFAAAFERLVNGIGFTALNRLVALRLAEERGLVVECVRKGLESEGFRIYQLIVEDQLGTPFETYRFFLHLIFDEMAEDARFLFDRRVPHGLVFPSEPVLRQVLSELGDKDLISLWKEDETIGWIYQYYNSPEERKKMREESSAPRNSRELAVRNQFFTPRYVVEFLTDNTLGRIWYEMTKGQTQLREQCGYLVRRPTEIFLQPGDAMPETGTSKENLLQEDLLRLPVHIPHRLLKDPRTIRLLDPACGSMHFGLYAFDLFTVLYDEAWEIAHGTNDAAKSAETFAPFVTFAASFADKAGFLREVPRLIVEHNVHGIDIDPRAAQVAGLSLWLRAQRAWHQAGVKPADRPRITRSNVVCAEPMPGEKELLREFVEKQFPASERPAFSFLLETIFDRMSVAGEAGSLLRIEEEISATIDEARTLAQSQVATLFFETDGGGKAAVDLRSTNDELFWQAAEQRIYDALEAYAEQAENGGAFQRRLFADDAAQGFAFIDLCRKRYDVVVMNPPFGKCSEDTEAYFRTNYPNNWKELYAAFFERALVLIDEHGSVASISSSQFLYTKQMKNLRAVLMETNAVEFFVELGLGVLDGATVDTALSVFAPETKVTRRETLYLDLSNTDLVEKPSKLLQSVTDSGQFKAFSLTKFSRLETNPFCFHAAPQLLSLWDQPERFDPDLGRVATGNHTFDDWRFLRLRWEISPVHIAQDWVGYEKGGEYQPFLSPTPLLVNWAHDGAELRTINREHNGTEAQVMQSSSLWFQSGICYSHVSSIAFGPRILPEGHIFSSESISLFPKEPKIRLMLLGLLCSTITQDLIWCYGRYRKIENRAVSNLPFSDAVIASLNPRFGALAHQAISEVQRIERLDEVSPLFVNSIPKPQSLNSALEAINESNKNLKVLYDELDALSESALFARSDLPDLQAKRRRELTDVFAFRNLRRDSDAAAAVISQIIGTVFGRWDIRYATGERPAPELPDPFAPLPVCPPGMLQGDVGRPLSPEAGVRLRSEGRYPIDVAWDGILVDDAEHAFDIVRRVQAALKVIWGDRTDDIEQEACSTLVVPTLREWFGRHAGFFADHLKRYSKSRRRAPIYWPLSTASGNYTLWIYYHRLDEQTLYRAVEDFVRPKVASVERKRDALEVKVRDNVLAAGKEREQLQSLRAFASELADFRDELLRVAALPYKPELNDGVVVTAAPLHNLFRYKPWVKELDEVWKKLEKGDYDWSHMAMHLWPDRVRAKCVEDRSLAIAHDLESICTAPDPTKHSGQKRGRKKKEAALIDEEEEV